MCVARHVHSQIQAEDQAAIPHNFPAITCLSSRRTSDVDNQHISMLEIDDPSAHDSRANDKHAQGSIWKMTVQVLSGSEVGKGFIQIRKLNSRCKTLSAAIPSNVISYMLLHT